MFRDEFATVGDYHKYLEKIEEVIYREWYFDIHKDGDIGDGLAVYWADGGDNASHHIRPMFQVKRDHGGSCDYCWTCKTPGDDPFYWETYRTIWSKDQGKFNTEHDPELMAKENHP